MFRCRILHCRHLRVPGHDGQLRWCAMLPRFSTRRCFLTLLCVTALLFIVVNLVAHQEDGANSPTNPKTKRAHLFESIILGPFESWTQSTTSTVADVEVTETTTLAKEPLPWYMAKGKRLPKPAKISLSGRRIAKLFPGEDRGADRIENQLMFYPPEPIEPGQVKKILMFNGLTSWGLKAGRETFAECPINTCSLSANRVDAEDADAILFKDHLVHPGIQRPAKQVWILYLLECPYHTAHVKYNDLVNWTATYRSDSDIVAPYEKWVYHDAAVTEFQGPLRDFAANKTDKVAWFVSNCGARNGRLQYAQELQKHIQVDIYGACGKHKCPRSLAEKCFELLDKKYKFYLAFENSNCKDYITEKFFVNGLGRNILPIVMGARPEDYAKSAPKHSYIHVDDFASPKQLAEYLHKLDKDDDLYNAYFKWKGTGEFINTHFFCRLCALLHDDYPVKSYRDINEWWRGAGTCTTSSWRTLRD
ncbi:glycoprotein 3-alpha-L-fucosyltransferase A isoform X1 [Homalodisca vitripennis]|uniref:glycoprotein 3-alpha-L-fucosyltransferase A isoform X1 n=2 Tax=Homalodisca vitripennis TaxID=197043 RepID=UPI001EE9EA05|nr:glycoprotein 3-alpha-L-fucosyltransferase A isoform X1 [Homalodisca vitripennis]